MVFILKYWKIILIGTMAVTIGIGTKLYMSEIENRKIAESNVEQLTLDHNAKILYIKDKIQKKYLISQDSLAISLMDSFNLRPAKIERIFSTKYVYIHDTVIVDLISNNIDTTFKSFNYNFDACNSIKGRVNWDEDILIFDEFKNDFDMTTLYYWDRKCRWLWIFSPKLHYAVTSNNCTGESISTEIIFEKK